MRWMVGLRALVYLRQIARSAERQAVAAETLARISQDEWEAAHAPRPRGKFVIGTLDQAAANKYYRETHRDEFDLSAE